MKVGITGANSFIGKNLINYLLKKNFSLILFSRNISNLGHFKTNRFIQLVEIDMYSYENIGKHVPMNLDAFIHLAWDGTRGEIRNDEIIQKNNYLNSIKLFKALNEMKCKNIISFGSQAEYGEQDHYITEDSIPKPTTFYGKYKLALSNYLVSEFSQTYFWFRIFSAYGPLDYENTLIMRLIKGIKSNEKFIDLTSCEQNWNYIYIDDIVEVTYRAITSNSALKGVYNLASTDNRKLKDFVFEVKKITNSNIHLKFGSISSDYQIVSFKADVSKLIKNLKKPFFIDFKKGILSIYNSISL
jgi:nucleoside-diphosphate-sugar epimerase